VRGELAQSLLADIVLSTVTIGPNTPLTKIIKFREKHEDELGRFRSSMRKLVEGVSGKMRFERLKSHLDTVYKDELKPEIEKLRARLKDNRISCGFNNLKASTLLTTSPTAGGVALGALGFGSFALLAGVGISIVLSVANCRIQRREILRDSPFSYVLSAERTFGSRKTKNTK
jgi:hypothetical protein